MFKVILKLVVKSGCSMSTFSVGIKANDLMTTAINVAKEPNKPIHFERFFGAIATSTANKRGINNSSKI
jgi:hypothetical protein